MQGGCFFFFFQALCLINVSLKVTMSPMYFYKLIFNSQFFVAFLLGYWDNFSVVVAF